MHALMAIGPAPSASAPDDGALLSAVAERGDEAALVTLYLRHLDITYRLALRLAGNAAAAEEAVHEGLVDAWSAARSYRGSGSVRSWLLSLVANACRRQVRATSRRRRLEAAAVEHRGNDPGPRDEAREMARAALDSLPERYRVPVAMRYLDGFGFDEIAASLGIREKSARTRVARGLDRLRERCAGSAPAAALAKAAWTITPPAGLADRVATCALSLPKTAGAASAAGAWTLAIAMALLLAGATAAVVLKRQRPVSADASPTPVGADLDRFVPPPALQGTSARVPADHELILVKVAGDAREWNVRVGAHSWNVRPGDVQAGLRPLRELFVKIAIDSAERRIDRLYGNWPRPMLLVELDIDGATPVLAAVSVAAALRQSVFERAAPAKLPAFPDGTQRYVEADVHGNFPAGLLPRPFPEGYVSVHIPGVSGNDLALDLPWFDAVVPAACDLIRVTSDAHGVTVVTPPGGVALVLQPSLAAAAPPDQFAALSRCASGIATALRATSPPQSGPVGGRMLDRGRLPPVVIQVDPRVPWSDVIAVLDAAVAYERSCDLILPGQPGVARRTFVIASVSAAAR